jgi:hypothetical protein
LIGRGINALAGAVPCRAVAAPLPMKVAMIVSPGETFQVCFITRIDGVAHLCRGAGAGVSDALGALVSGIGGMIRMIGCVGWFGWFGWLPLRRNGY